MSKVSLTANQKQEVLRYLKSFLDYTKSERFAQDQQDRQQRIAYFQRDLARTVGDISEADLSELVTKLWASQMWGNKQYLAQKIISDTGIDKLRQELSILWDTTRPVASRYDRFLREIKGLGPASLTEMLCYIQPSQCGIWNRKAREALKLLGLDTLLNPDKYRLTATEYETFNDLLQAIAAELKAVGLADVDLLLVNYFLYEVGESTIRPQLGPVTPEAFDHDEMRDLLQNVGVMLGFDAETEVQVGHGARVDVVWRARIGNLGLVTYVFEVQKGGSIDGLLLNLQRAKSSATVQKVIAVSDEAQLERVQRECTGLPEEFRRSLALWPVSQVLDVAQHLQSAMEVINRLGLVQGSF